MSVRGTRVRVVVSSNLSAGYSMDNFPHLFVLKVSLTIEYNSKSCCTSLHSLWQSSRF